jgi:hypothetical protein
LRQELEREWAKTVADNWIRSRSEVPRDIAITVENRYRRP